VRAEMRAGARTKAHRITMPFRFVPSILLTIAFSKDAFPNRRRTFARLDQIIQPAKTSPIALRDGFA
jgi:hypothetical protein